MRPLYDARIGHLGPGEFVQVECACGHTELLTAAMLATAGVARIAKCSTWATGYGAGNAMSEGRWWCR